MKMYMLLSEKKNKNHQGKLKQGLLRALKIRMIPQGKEGKVYNDKEDLRLIKFQICLVVISTWLRIGLNKLTF